jgi:hypothetical protein
MRADLRDQLVSFVAGKRPSGVFEPPEVVVNQRVSRGGHDPGPKAVTPGLRHGTRQTFPS